MQKRVEESAAPPKPRNQHEFQHSDGPTWCIHCGTFDVYCSGNCDVPRTGAFDSRVNFKPMFEDVFGGNPPNYLTNQAITMPPAEVVVSTKIQLFPANTLIYEPDPIHRVTVQFPTENDAIVFFEWCRQLSETQAREGDGERRTDASSPK